MNDDKLTGFHVGDDINIDNETKKNSEYGLFCYFGFPFFYFVAFNLIVLSVFDDNDQKCKR